MPNTVSSGSARTLLQVLFVSDKRAEPLRRLRDMARDGRLPLGWGGPVLRVADDLVLPLQEVGGGCAGVVVV